ncbi:MAG: UvrD-helicase domain-containing protein [Verrucomicrobia bacterium]|nr:UvrD-helicase domain-containing protein [Verrucomicrobiota bacterium]
MARYSLKPTDEQEAVISSDLSPETLLIINAYAGTGKTASLELLAAASPKKTFVYLCFNKETAIKARRRFPKNTECRTIHSFAFRATGYRYKQKIGNLRPLVVMKLLGLKTPHVAVFIIQVVERFFYSVDAEIGEKHLPSVLECLINPSTLLYEARRLWKLMQDVSSSCPMTHDGYLKLWSLSTPLLHGYDVILLDEAQDINPVTLDIVLRQNTSLRTPLVMVGDKHQSIYQFRHAINVIEKLEGYATSSVSLTSCFRFGANIASVATRFLNQFKNDPVQLVGVGPSKSRLSGSATISRTNAFLIGAAIPYSEAGELLHFAGTSERESWDPYYTYEFQTPLDLLFLKQGDRSRIRTPYIMAFKSWAEVLDHAQGQDGSGADDELAKHVALVNTYGDSLPSIIDSIRSNSTSPSKASISFATAHRAKGGEWRRVKMTDDFTLLDELLSMKELLPRGEENDDCFQEMNLLYVAMTRGAEQVDFNQDLNQWLKKDGSQTIDLDTNQNIKLSNKMNDTEWVLIDTETDGFAEPVHVVEIAAQKMRGWLPDGDKFRVLLNHNVDIPEAATAIHGYTKAFLAKNGVDPIAAHQQFSTFVGDRPIVSHNLSFDWNRALFSEWLRLGLPPAGRRGFCSLMLCRRVIGDADSYSLSYLADRFDINASHAHRAFGDVDTLTTLFTSVIYPRIASIGLDSFESLTEFSKKTPIAKCLSALSSAKNEIVASKPEFTDHWYFIDPNENQALGPFPASIILEKTAPLTCWVWREGMQDWTASNEDAEFIRCSETQLNHLPGPLEETERAKLSELMGLCQGLIADGKITTSEVSYLGDWFAKAGPIRNWPGTEIADTLERITEDGYVSKEEKLELLALLRRVCP